MKIIPGKLYRAKRHFYEFEPGEICMVTKISILPPSRARYTGEAKITFLKGVKEIEVPFKPSQMSLEDWIDSWIEEYNQ